MFNGRIPGDLNGEFTCTANEGTSIVDYMLASTEFFQYVSHFSVEELDESVHFPLKCSLVFPSVPIVNIAVANVSCTVCDYVRCRWKAEQSDTFADRVLESLKTVYRELCDRIDNNVNDAVECLLCVFYNSADHMKCHPCRYVQKSQPDWWEEQCDLLKSKKVHLLRRFRININVNDLQLYKVSKGKFKQACRVKKVNYQQRRRSFLVSVKNNPEKFWKALKSCNSFSNRNTCNIECGTWYTYFKSLLQLDVSD